jgi:hypothetical protein
MLIILRHLLPICWEHIGEVSLLLPGLFSDRDEERDLDLSPDKLVWVVLELEVPLDTDHLH